MDEELVPDADLMESMRAVGYSLKTAIADLCDNSISAQAQKIEINWNLEPAPFLYVLDDGVGMTKDTLRVAMKLAGKSPLSARSESDLGRFGLGLKTASLSQARSLAVITKFEGQTSAAVWDLDHLSETGKWNLTWLSLDDLENVPGFLKIKAQESGTLVVWRKLDQLIDQDEADVNYLSSKFEEVSSHLGLVFHRFLSAKSGRVDIKLNSSNLPIFDPFLEGEPGVVDRGVTNVIVSGEKVSVQPFILPGLNRMSRAQREKALFDDAKMRSAQGFYIYRNKRLLSWGTWFRMAPMDEVGKLARVRVETGNALDSQWKLGIMKSSVQPPKPLLDALRRLVPEIIENSTRAARGKSRVQSRSEGQVWKVNELGNQAFELAVNGEHPMITNLHNELDEGERRAFEAIIKLLEVSLPATYIHQRLSRDDSMREGLQSNEEIWAVAEALFSQFEHSFSGATELIWDMVEAVEPFRSDTQLKSRLRAIRNGDIN